MIGIVKFVECVLDCELCEFLYHTMDVDSKRGMLLSWSFL